MFQLTSGSVDLDVGNAALESGLGSPFHFLDLRGEPS